MGRTRPQVSQAAIDRYWRTNKAAHRFDAKLSKLGLIGMAAGSSIGKWIYYSYGTDPNQSFGGCGAEIVGTVVHHDTKFLVIRPKFSGGSLIGQYGSMIEVSAKNLGRIRYLTAEQINNWRLHDTALKRKDCNETATGVHDKSVRGD